MNLERLLLPHEGTSFVASIDFSVLLNYEGTIYLLSAITSLLFALTVYLLQRNIKILHKKEWVLPFAHTFSVFALIHFVRLFHLSQYPETKLSQIYPINIIVFLCSGLTNFLLLLSAFRLTKPALHERVILQLGRLHIGRAYMRYVVLGIICSASLLRIMGEGWPRVPDTIISFLALTVMGYLLYQNISYHRDKVMAWVALLSSVGYAVFYLVRPYGLVEFLVRNALPVGVSPDIDKIADILFFLIFLIFKFGLFLSAYSLMLILSAPFEGIEQLNKRVNEKKKEFLENDGIVRSIHDELHFGSVRLIIKLPGLTDNKIAVYSFPPSGPGPRQGPRIEDYEEDTDYDNVMKSGKSHIDPRKGYPYWFIRRIANATVPIRFHEAVIACLYAERGEGKFTEADLSILERIASMIAPTVQVYREMTAINKFNQDVSERQIKVDEYEMERDIGGITESIHDIVAPLAMWLSIEAGFSELSIAYPRDGEFTELVKRQLKAGLVDEDFVDREKNRWLKLGLKIPYESTLDKTPGEQNLGKLLFLGESEKKKNSEVTVGTNPVFRQVLSDLMTDILLDFIRGYLSYLTDDLGATLSGLKETEFERWHKEVQESARKAGLLWVVAKVSDGRSGQRWLGEDERRHLVQKVESLELKGNWQEKTKDLQLYSLDEANDVPCHVIRFCKYSEDSEDSRAALWFGVARREFGEELNYISPWRYFLEHFCEIAHAALLRIQRLIQEEMAKKDLLLIYSMSGETIDYGDALHRLGNQTQQLKLPIKGFRAAVSKNGLQMSGDVKGWLDSVKEWLDSLEAGCLHIEKTLKSLSSSLSRDTKKTCSLDDVISEVCDESESSLKEYGIKLEKNCLPSGLTVNVPFIVARSAVSNIFNNARDALRDERRTDKEKDPKTINISVRPEGKKVVCEISDNGPGVDEAILPKLFYEVAKGPKDNSNGVGLLFSRIFLNTFGGFMRHQKTDHKGATFHIEFPIYSELADHP